MQCNVKLRKLLSAHKSHVRETSLFTGAIPNTVHNSQTSRFVSVPGQNPGRSSRGDSVVLRMQSVMMADVWWCRSRTGIGYIIGYYYHILLLSYCYYYYISIYYIDTCSSVIHINRPKRNSEFTQI